jgi:PAS domain S-box-containing protein
MRPRRRQRGPGGDGIDVVQLALIGEAMAETSEVGVFVWNDDRRYVAANAAACTLAGVSRDELLGMRVGDLTPERAAPLLESLRGASPVTGESTIVRRDGSEVEIAWVTFRTKVAGLPYMTSVCWPRDGGGR